MRGLSSNIQPIRGGDEVISESPHFIVTKSQWLLLHQTMLLNLDENVVSSKVAKFETHLQNVTCNITSRKLQRGSQIFPPVNNLVSAWISVSWGEQGYSGHTLLMGVTLQFSEYSVRYLAKIKRGSVKQWAVTVTNIPEKEKNAWVGYTNEDMVEWLWTWQSI